MDDPERALGEPDPRRAGEAKGRGMIDFRTQLAIDKTASADRVSLLKRAGAVTPEDALKQSIASGLADDEIIDQAAWIAAQTKAYNDHVAKGVVDIRKGATNVDRNSETLMMFAKMAIDQGRSPGLTKSVFIAGITLRADAIRKAGESAAQAFTRALVDDEIGKTLWAAAKVSLGPELEPAPVEAPKQPSYMGQPGHAKLEVLARDHQLQNPRKTIEQARSHVYSAPENTALRSQCQQEHFDAISKAMAA
jgi:hypothetical protein